MKYLYLLLILIVFFGCSHQPNVSSDPINILKINLNQFEFDSISSSSDIINLENVSNEVLDFQFNSCLSIGSVRDSGTFNRLQLFKNDPYIKQLNRELVTTVYPQINQIHEELIISFKYLRYYFPQIVVPKSIIYYNSLYHANIFCGKKELGIGIECYLGPNSPSVKKLPSQEFFQWLKNSMRLEYLKRDALSAWIISNYIPDNSTSVVENMIRWGKIIYLVERCLPEDDQNYLLRYSKEKFNWAEKNERLIWKYLVNEQLLFSKNDRDISFLINEGPFTIGLPEKSPDRLGQYIGWKMVHDYMEEHENTSLRDLVNTPYNSILQTYNSED